MRVSGRYMTHSRLSVNANLGGRCVIVFYYSFVHLTDRSIAENFPHSDVGIPTF